MQALKNNHGAALIEFALILPVLLVLVFGGTELGRYALVQLKVQSASYALANAVTQYSPASKPTVAQLGANEISYNALVNMFGSTALGSSNALTKMLEPFGDVANQRVIVTSIRKEAGVKRIKWEVTFSGNLGDVKSIVTGKGPVDINAFIQNQPTNFDAATNASLANMPDNENVIVVEVFYRYTPLVGVAIGDIDFANRTISKVTMMRPRNGDLICLPSTVNTRFIYPADCS
jgi:Flp pilus assembly protein TadG